MLEKSNYLRALKKSDIPKLKKNLQFSFLAFYQKNFWQRCIKVWFLTIKHVFKTVQNIVFD